MNFPACLTVCLFLSLGLSSAQTALFTKLPQPLQFFGRDSQDSAVVTVEGTVTAAGHDSVSLALLKNNNPVVIQTAHLQYGAGGAPFTLSVKIHAELAQYRIRVLADTVLLADRDSLLCGDAFLIEGQSNSITRASYAGRSAWIRTFGNEASAADTGFYTAQAMTQDSRAAIGVWGMRLAEKLVDSFDIPIFILNGGVGGSTIEAHARDTSHSAIYGRHFYRSRKAGLQNHIKAVFWHQGENNTDATYSTYAAKFLALCSAWKSDYPAVRYMTLFQIRPGCGFDFQGQLREVQRTLPSMRDSLRIMSTMGLPGHDGCHYSPEGYFAMAEWLYPLVARDYYGSTDTMGITPPNILRASFADTSKRIVSVEFDQPVVWPANIGNVSLLSYLYLDGVAGQLDSAKVSVQNKLTLFLKARSTATRLTYLPDVGSYSGPWLRNNRGIGALTFSGFPIDSFGTNPTRMENPGMAVHRDLKMTPNPFNPSTTIILAGFHGSLQQAVSLRIFASDGRCVADLSEQASRRDRIPWRADGLSSGVYVVQCRVGNTNRQIRAVLIR